MSRAVTWICCSMALDASQTLDALWLLFGIITQNTLCTQQVNTRRTLKALCSKSQTPADRKWTFEEKKKSQQQCHNSAADIYTTEVHQSCKQAFHTAVKFNIQRFSFCTSENTFVTSDLCHILTGGVWSRFIISIFTDTQLQRITLNWTQQDWTERFAWQARVQHTNVKLQQPERQQTTAFTVHLLSKSFSESVSESVAK